MKKIKVKEKTLCRCKNIYLLESVKFRLRRGENDETMVS